MMYFGNGKNFKEAYCIFLFITLSFHFSKISDWNRYNFVRTTLFLYLPKNAGVLNAQKGIFFQAPTLSPRRAE